MDFRKVVFYFFIFFALVILGLVVFDLFLKYTNNQLSFIKQKGNNNMTQKIIRPSAVAGSFYPAEEKELKLMINQLLNQASTTSAFSPKILIVPHAGYPYSGGVAAFGFKQLVGQNIKRAIILGPSHHFPASGLFLSPADFWQTPLGTVPVAKINADLAKEKGFEINADIHQPEHALELEIPFLQTVLPEVEIVPIIVGELNPAAQKKLADTLAKYLDEKTILIVSLDLSHYHPATEAKLLDNQSINDILNLDPTAILEDEIDAPWAVSSVLILAKRKNWQPQLLKYAHSGDITGDNSAVVGYAAIGFFDQAANESATGENASEYTADEKAELLKVARTTIETYLKTGKIFEPETKNPKFQEPRGVFVTLNKAGRLRGCIGYVEPIKSILEAVRDNAIAAATEDDRFSPVTIDELNSLEIEISVLTVPQDDTLENITQNRLGVVLHQGQRGATYLPQVWEEVTDPTDFFSSLCLKVGLVKDCYQDQKTTFTSYRAIVFHE